MVDILIESNSILLAIIFCLAFILGHALKGRMAAGLVLITCLGFLLLKQHTVPYTVKLYNQVATSSKNSTKQTKITTKPLPRLPNVELTPGLFYVDTPLLKVRSEPNYNGKSIFELKQGDLVRVTRNIAGWVMVSSEFLGIRYGESGSISAWVRANYLASYEYQDIDKPLKLEVFAAIGQSDNIKQYSQQMVAKSSALIESNKCNLQDFRKNLGWTKKDRYTYFTLCGKDTVIEHRYDTQ